MTQKRLRQSELTTKEIIREYSKDLRSSLSKQELEDAARGVAFQLADFAPFISATTILTYAAIQNEISPETALSLREQIAGPNSARIAYPRTTGRRTMDAHEASVKDLKVGNYDLLEPDRKAPIIDPEFIDVVLVPGLAFDKMGYRVGYGKGYYDTFLPRLTDHAVTVGITYDNQLLDAIPRAEHDIAIDFVVTPSGLYACEGCDPLDSIDKPESFT